MIWQKYYYILNLIFKLNIGRVIARIKISLCQIIHLTNFNHQISVRIVTLAKQLKYIDKTNQMTIVRILLYSMSASYCQWTCSLMSSKARAQCDLHTEHPHTRKQVYYFCKMHARCSRIQSLTSRASIRSMLYRYRQCIAHMYYSSLLLHRHSTCTRLRIIRLYICSSKSIYTYEHVRICTASHMMNT